MGFALGAKGANSITQVMCWDRGRPARKRATRRAISLHWSFRALRSWRAGRPRSQHISWMV